MIDPDRNLETTLKLARMLAEPSMADGARVLSALQSGLAASPDAGGATRASSRVQPRAAAASKPALQGAALPQLITVGVVAAALGFAAGWGLRDTTRSADPAPREMSSLPPAPMNEPETMPESAPPAEPTLPAERDEPGASAAATPAAAATTKPRANKPAHKPAQRVAPAQDSTEFFEAVNLLRRAQRAVNRGEGQLALSLLAELDTRFDGKTLREERQATRALALCASGDVEAATRVARELARVAPSSIYAARLRLSCTGWFSASGAAEPRANDGNDAERGTEPPRP